MSLTGSDRLLPSALPSSPPHALSLTGYGTSELVPVPVPPRAQATAPRAAPGRTGPPLPPSGWTSAAASAAPKPDLRRQPRGTAVLAPPRFVACDLCRHNCDLYLSFRRKFLFPVIYANEEDKQRRGRRDGWLKVEDEQCTQATGGRR